jgi:hypothetical protein
VSDANSGDPKSSTGGGSARPDKSQTKLGTDLCDLYGTILAAAISFLPALYVFIAPQARRFGLTHRSAAVLWLFIAMVLLNEWWQNRIVYFRHHMGFGRLFFLPPRLVLSIYVSAASISMLALIALPAAVTYRVFDEGGTPVVPKCIGECALSGYSLLRPIVALLIIHHLFALTATLMKYGIPMERERGDVWLQIIADLVRPFLYGAYVLLSSNHPSFLVGMIVIPLIYVSGVGAQWWAIAKGIHIRTTQDQLRTTEDQLKEALAENESLRKRNKTLQERLGLEDPPPDVDEE